MDATLPSQLKKFREKKVRWEPPKWLCMPHSGTLPGLQKPTGYLLQKCSRWRKVGLRSILCNDHHLAFGDHSPGKGAYNTLGDRKPLTEVSNNKSSGLEWIYQAPPLIDEETESQGNQSTYLRSCSKVHAVFSYFWMYNWKCSNKSVSNPLLVTDPKYLLLKRFMTSTQTLSFACLYHLNPLTFSSEGRSCGK